MGSWESEFSEDALSDPQAFLLHAGQRGARYVFGATHAGEAALLQDEVIVSRGIHGVKNVGVVWNLQLCEGRRENISVCEEEKHREGNRITFN